MCAEARGAINEHDVRTLEMDAMDEIRRLNLVLSLHLCLCGVDSKRLKMFLPYENGDNLTS